MTRSILLEEAGFSHVFPERGADGGEIAALLGAPGGVVQVRQVHGARAVEGRGAAGSEADAIVARAGDGRAAVGVRVADCAPVLVASAETGDVAAIHAGWRGVVAGVVRAGVELLGGRGLVAAIGPCIGPCCFEVGRDVAARIAAAAPGAAVIAPRPHASPDKAYVDLRAAVRAQLLAAGVGVEHVEDVPGCTMHEAERFHSFRRDGAGGGRMLAAIVTKPRLAP